MLIFLRCFTEFPLLGKKFQNPAYHKYAERTGSALDQNHPPVPNPVSEAKRYCWSYGFLTRRGLRSFFNGHKTSLCQPVWLPSAERAHSRFLWLFGLDQCQLHTMIFDTVNRETYFPVHSVIVHALERPMSATYFCG